MGKILGAAAPVIGGAVGGPAGLAAGGAIGGILGGKDRGQAAMASGGSMQSSGFAALPPEVQQAYLQQYLPQILEQFQNGGTKLAEFNPMQEQALQSIGGGLSGLKSELPGYQELYNENVLNPELERIDQDLEAAQNNLAAQQGASGNLGSLFSSAAGGQIAGLQAAAANMRRDARQNAYSSGKDLRRETLQDMLKSGTAYQNQTQQQYAQPQANLSQFAGNLAGVPGSSIGQTNNMQTGATGPRPDFLTKLGGAGISALGLGQQLGWQGFGGQNSTPPWQQSNYGGW